MASARSVSLPLLDAPVDRPVDAWGPRSLDAVRMLRISLTDRCHLRCRYCMPAEGVEFLPRDRLLCAADIEQVVRAAAALGVTHVKLTGGEPTLRRDLLEIVGRLRAIPQLELSMTTNGLRLPGLAESLRDAGLDRVTISVDSLRPERYRDITGGGRLDLLHRGLDAAGEWFPSVKLNVVVMGGVNDDEIGDFARLAVDRDWTVRFIEFMPIGCSVEIDRGSDATLVDADLMRRQVEAEIGPLQPLERRAEPGVGPATVHATSAGRGRIGFIHAMSRPFCDRCNRLRLDAVGVLRSCLFDGGEVDLRPLLAGGHEPTDPVWRRAFAACTALKPDTHGSRGDRAMSSIGG